MFSPKLLKTLKVILFCAWSKDKKIRYQFVISIISNFLFLVSTTLLPILFRYTIDSYSQASSEHNETLFLFFLMLYIITWLTSRFFFYLREINVFPVMENIVYSLSLKLFKHILSLSFQYHTGRKTGQITSSIEAINNSTPSIILNLFFSICPLIIESSFAFLAILYFCGFIYASIIAGSFILFICFTNSNFLKLFRLFHKASIARSTTSAKIVDSLLNFSSIKHYHAYEYEFAKAEKIFKTQEVTQKEAYVKAETGRFYQTSIISLLLCLLIFYSGYNTMNNNLSLGSFMMINYYIFHFMVRLETFGQVFQQFNQGLIRMAKALQSLNYPIEPKWGPIRLNSEEPLHIIFEDVWFGYDINNPILRGVSFELRPNNVLSIVGESGSGKSTIIGLLLKFYVPWSGRILINNHDLQDIDHQSLIDLISIVPQDICLFNDTIYNNIHYANPMATQDKILEAINNSCLEKSINNFPFGLETIVGERGIQLSGGEKQRVSIARAFIRSPKLYIFDEGTSALDINTEKEIISSLKTVSKNAGLILITHRPSALWGSDQVITLEMGRIQSTAV